jgi:hypothetical protein
MGTAHHHPRVVASCFDCGDALGEQLIPLALPLLQRFDLRQYLRLESGHVEVRSQGLLGRPYLELCRAGVALQEPSTVLRFSPTPPTL